MYVLSKNKKNNVYPCKPQFYYIKVGFKGVKIISACFRDGVDSTTTVDPFQKVGSNNSDRVASADGIILKWWPLRAINAVRKLKQQIRLKFRNRRQALIWTGRQTETVVNYKHTSSYQNYNTDDRLRVMSTFSEEIILFFLKKEVYFKCFGSEKGSTLKVMNLLPWGGNYFLLQQTIFPKWLDV